MRIVMLGAKEHGGPGTTKNPTTPWSQSTISALVPVEVVDSPKYQSKGVGLAVMEMQAALGLWPSLASFKFPCVVDVETTDEMRSVRGRAEYQKIVVGCEYVAPFVPVQTAAQFHAQLVGE